MELSRRVILVLIIALVAAVTVPPCSLCSAEEQKDEENMWSEDEPRGPRPGRGRGPGRGPRRFEPTEEEIDRVMKSLQKSDPKKAKELEALRKKDPEQFREELRRYGGEEYGKIIRERIENSRKERQKEFIIFLEKNFPQVAQELVNLKNKEPDLYTKKYELAERKYGRIYGERRRNPELAEILLEDLKLKQSRDEIIVKIKASKSDNEKNKLVAELEEIIASRFDLIVRRKQMEYARLLRWLRELQERITESRGEIKKWMSDEFKDENVKKRTQDLLGENLKFSWD
jgi:hypothetical protein